MFKTLLGLVHLDRKIRSIGTIVTTRSLPRYLCIAYCLVQIRFHIQTQRTPLSLSLRLRTSTRAGPGFAQHQGRDPGAHPECLPVHFTISYGPHHTVSSFTSPATGARLLVIRASCACSGCFTSHLLLSL